MAIEHIELPEPIISFRRLIKESTKLGPASVKLLELVYRMPGLTTEQLMAILEMEKGTIAYKAATINKTITKNDIYLGNRRVDYMPGLEKKPLYQWYIFRKLTTPVNDRVAVEEKEILSLDTDTDCITETGDPHYE